MGYTTIFNRQIRVEPPLSPEEITYLNKFASTRRMACEQGPLRRSWRFWWDGP
jgi:hypothetical protein